MTLAFSRCAFALVVSFMLGAAPSWAQPQPLPMNGPVSAAATSEKPAEFTITAASAGVVLVAVQGTGDLVITLADEDGQVVPEGRSDRDLNGSGGTELLSATVTEPGKYTVVVALQGGGDQSTFQVSGAFVAFPPFARAPDPDRRPSQARPLTVGTPHDDTLDPAAGDAWDWFAFKSPEAGTLAIVTRPLDDTGGDLVLEVFGAGSFTERVDRSDQDMQGNAASESVTINVEAGETYYVKVTNQSFSPSKYRIASSLIK